MIEQELAQRVEVYQPNERVIKGLGSIELLGTVGATASGKTIVTELLIKNSTTLKISRITSDTSREPRQGEVDGVDYFFRSLEDMIGDLEQGSFVEVALSPTGDLYANRLIGFPKEGVGTMAILSHAVENFRRLPFRKTNFAFIVPESYENWQDWIHKQANNSKWSPKQLQNRLVEARQSYEFALGDKQMRFVLNDEVEKAARRLLQVAHGQAPDDEAGARQIAKTNYQRLVGGL